MFYSYYLKHLKVDWECCSCSITNPSDSFFNEKFEAQQETYNANYNNSHISHNASNQHKSNTTFISLEKDTTSNGSENNNNDRSKQNRNKFLVTHLNINSLQNKFDELKILNREFRSSIIFISETKIDKSYPNSQFYLSGYDIYRQDRAKGGGGLIAHVSSALPSKKLKLPKVYKTCELIAIEIKLGQTNITFVGIYRPPKQRRKTTLGAMYLEKVENELNVICMWLSMYKQTFVILGDLNSDRLKPESREEKILKTLKKSTL